VQDWAIIGCCPTHAHAVCMQTPVLQIVLESVSRQSPYQVYPPPHSPQPVQWPYSLASRLGASGNATPSRPIASASLNFTNKMLRSCFMVNYTLPRYSFRVKPILSQGQLDYRFNRFWPSRRLTCAGLSCLRRSIPALLFRLTGIRFGTRDKQGRSRA
jgi:hypothetical protein